MNHLMTRERNEATIDPKGIKAHVKTVEYETGLKQVNSAGFESPSQNIDSFVNVKPIGSKNDTAIGFNQDNNFDLEELKAFLDDGDKKHLNFAPQK